MGGYRLHGRWPSRVFEEIGSFDEELVATRMMSLISGCVKLAAKFYLNPQD